MSVANYHTPEYKEDFDRAMRRLEKNCPDLLPEEKDLHASMYAGFMEAYRNQGYAPFSKIPDEESISGSLETPISYLCGDSRGNGPSMG